VNIAYYPSGALRNMADPHNGGDQNDHYWQPAHVSEMYLGTQDNAGVHINNGIGNRLYYLYATATSKEKAEQVFYKALSEYMTSTSQFIDWRIAVIQAATDIFGENAEEVAEAGKAFDAVGIQEEEVLEDEPVYDTNPGQDYLLSYNTDIGYTGTLYRTSTAGTSFVKLTNTAMKRNVSVVDDGSVAFFVTEDDSIKKVSLNPSDPFESIVSPDAFWDNVAISKDGRRLAGISVEVDTAIYVYDFDSQQWRKFKLYNPTTSHTGSDAGGVLYADAIEFDITGEYLIYDAANVISSDLEEDIYYWDIGFMKVWDNTKGDFGDGSISKLFSSLPKNVSVGNPVFSKNSPFIIAFDYMYDDETVDFDEEFAVYAANLETNKIKSISDNETWGYPSFSKNDDRIAFTSFSTFGEDQVAFVDLETDIITPAGAKEELIAGSIWPVYYATGERDLGLPPVANFTVDAKAGNAPLLVKFVDLSTHNPTAWQWTFQGGSPAVSSEQHPEVTYSSNGTYSVTLTATNDNGNGSITKIAYITVSDATGINAPDESAPMFYPNPAQSQVNINYAEDFTVRLYNLQGQLLLSGKNQKLLDLSGVNPGVYLLELKTHDAVTRHKLVRE
ncbi:MAG: M4 family metallopeptidase, partial [Bacteroidales bacterium]|nr:M4 family metallopeptidase [Bacteroidales bacterium]